MSKGTRTGLTRETFLATSQTTKSLIGVTKYLLTEKTYKYVLLGQLQSDSIEKRFGWYRQLSGGNYFVSVRQIIEAEKSIRLKSLVSFSGFTMEDVKEIYKEAADLREEEIEMLSDSLLMLLDKDSFTFAERNLDDQNILFYISGYAARSVSNTIKCSACQSLLYQKKTLPQITFEQEREVSLQKYFI